MYEEPTMENRNPRPSLAVSVDTKAAKTDSNNLVGKSFSRNAKKRESSTVAAGTPIAATATVVKNQKPVQPKQKGVDKRPKPRSGQDGVGIHRKNGYQVTDSTDPDLDLFLDETGRKQNLAHLLNMKFQLAPRVNTSCPYWRSTHSDGKWVKGRRQHHGMHFNKDHYLQANCQFVVKADGDYSVYMADPDMLVPWESVEQIRIWGSELGSCPICLHPPVAARMTRCGHKYCWPCILHFLALSDKPTRPCPICDAPVKLQDLKSVVTLEQRQLKVGDTVDMRLMKRERHSLQPQPVTHAAKSGSPVSSQLAQPAYLSQVGQDHVYSKLLLATPQDVGKFILHWERLELLEQWDKEKDCPEACFIQQALDLLSQREGQTLQVLVDAEAASDFGQLSLDDRQDHAGWFDQAVSESATFSDDTKSVPDSTDSVYCRSRYTSMSSEGVFDHRPGTRLEDVDESENGAACAPSIAVRAAGQHKDVFYFYQSSDGQAIYLHPLNIQMLVRHYGALELCPEVVEGRIVESETLSMTEELRNRMRYLGHVSLSTQFQIAEISLEEPVVDAAVLEEFRERIIERQSRRRRKDREERRRDIEIQRAEEVKWGKSVKQPAVRLDSKVHFPGFSSPTSDGDPPLPSPREDDPELRPSPEIDDTPSGGDGPSFAQMLRQGKNKSNAWPVKWGVEAGVKSGQGNRTRTLVDGYQDCEDYAPAPEFRETFGTALAAAFDKAAKSMDASASSAGEVPAGGRSNKKGRKNKPKVLFATGMNFM